jgi:hypothetical protein
MGIVTPNSPPVITGSSFFSGVNQATAAATMIASTSDPDGDPITQYAFYDTGAGGGHFVLSGVTQASGTWIVVDAANLANLSYVGGTTSGNEALYMVASDGKTWSESYTITAATVVTGQSPLVIGKNVNVAVSGSTAASSMIDQIYPNNGAIIQYAFYDTGTGGGHFVLNGVTQASGAWIVVTAANLANLSYVGGTGVGKESVYVEVSNSTTWSSAYLLTAYTTGVNHAPSVVGKSVTVGKNASVAASTMLKTVTDADSDTITQYAFWDNGAGGGHFTLSGVTQASGQWIVVSAANLANLRYVGGSVLGNEKIYVEVYDGKTWSSTAQLTASTKNVVLQAVAAKSEMAWTTGTLSNFGGAGLLSAGPLDGNFTSSVSTQVSHCLALTAR